MATYRGMDGSFAVGANVVLNVTQWAVNTNLTILDTTYMTLKWQTARSGMAHWSGSFTVNLDYGDTLGQKLLIDGVLTANPDGAIAAVTFLMATGKTLSGAICLTGFPISAPLMGLITASVNFEGNGPLTLAWA